MVGISAKSEINNDEIAEPELYLGGNVEKFQLPNGKHAWSITSTSYMKGAIDTVQRLLAKYGRTLNTGNRPYKGTLPYGYKPELDTTDECDADHTSSYQYLIGILCWAVELGHINIQLEVALMSQYQMSPREGNLEAIYFIFHFLWNNPKKKQVMDSYTPIIYESVFHSNADWVEFYGYVVEGDPPRMPETFGKPVLTSNFLTLTMLQNLSLGDHIKV